MRNVEGTADGVAVIVFLVFRHAVLKEIARVESVVAHELVNIAVEMTGARFGFHFHRAGAIASILRAIVGSEHAEFGDRIEAGISVEGGVAAVIHVVAAVNLPVVVFHASAVHAELHIAAQAGARLIVSSLIAYAGSHCGQLGKVAAIQLELCDLPAGHCARELGRLGLHLGNVFSLHHHFRSHGAHLQGSVNPKFLCDAKDDILDLIGLKSLGGDAQVIGGRGQSGRQIIAIGVGGSGAVETASRIGYLHIGIGNHRAAVVAHSSGDRRRVLGRQQRSSA